MTISDSADSSIQFKNKVSFRSKLETVVIIRAGNHIYGGDCCGGIPGRFLESEIGTKKLTKLNIFASLLPQKLRKK